MNIKIIRGTHQIGGVATEIRTETTRIIIDMGDELSLNSDYVSAPLDIPGVTDSNGTCDGVLFTHYHGDHIGQLMRIRDDIPLFSGELAKEIMYASADHQYKRCDSLCKRIITLKTFEAGKLFKIGDISITPYSIDHSACDSYMFLIEADGKRILYTGDFRLHGFRGKAIPKILRKIGKVDVILTEGTTLSRANIKPMTEAELQRKIENYLKEYKYVFVLCSSTNLERICAFSKAVPVGKYFVCDAYQKSLISLIEKHWSVYSPLYRNVKATVYGDNIFDKLSERGFLMTVRDNMEFRKIIKKFDPRQSIIIYSMWEGYLTKADGSLEDFLKTTNQWATLHTSGHASHKDLQTVINIANPDIIIPMHTDNPHAFQELISGKRIVILNDNISFKI